MTVAVYRRHIILSITILAATGLASRIDAQVACNERLVGQAQDLYELGWFHQSIEVLQPCLRDGVDDTRVRASAYRIAALSYIAIDSPELARESVAGLLRVDPGYRPDPDIDNLVFQGMVDDVKPRWYTWFWRGNQWYRWVGRGTLVSGIVMVPLLLRGNIVPDLPEAPPDPE